MAARLLRSRRCWHRSSGLNFGLKGSPVVFRTTGNTHVRPPRLQSPSLSSILSGSFRPYVSSAATAPVKHTPNFIPPTKEDLAELREQVREFTRREIPESYASQIDRDNNFPKSMWSKLGSAGFLGVTAEQDYGGLELGYQAHCIVMEELSRSSASIALSYAAHSQLCNNQLTLHGNPSQKSRLLPPLISGSKIGALAMSEVGSGSDVVSMKTTATKTPDSSGWLLNGSKMWITNGPDADIIVVYAKTDPQASPPSKGITAFILEPKDPSSASGFSVSRKIDKLGMRGSNTGELVFQDCFIPAENQLGELNKGVKILMSGLDLERLVLAAGPVGIMQSCLDHTLPYIHERKQFGVPIAHFQLIQDKVANMYTNLQASRAYLYNTAARADNESVVSSRDCAGVILYAAERATHCALDAIQCFGGNGYTNDYPVSRLLRDAKLYEIGAGTTEVRKIVIGRSFAKEWEENGAFGF